MIVDLIDYFHPLVIKICKRHVVTTNTINQSFSLTVIAKPTTETAKAKKVIFFFILSSEIILNKKFIHKNSLFFWQNFKSSQQTKNIKNNVSNYET